MLELEDKVAIEDKKKSGDGRAVVHQNGDQAQSVAVADETVLEPVPPVVEEQVGDKQTTEKHTTPFFRRKPVLVVLLIVFLTGAGVGVKYWLYARSHESTDDAFIDGHIVQISPKASGYVARLYVDDNQFVKIGDLLVELDARDYEARLDHAR